MSRELRLRLVLGLNLALAAGLVVAGVFAHSLGLFAAAGDTFTDIGAVLLALLAVRLTRRSPTAQRSFGYHRSTILAAQANAAAMLLVCGVIVIEAVRRLQNPPAVHGGLVLVAAAVAAVANGAAALVVAGDRNDLNMRAVLLDTMGDAAANAGVAGAGAVILVTGAYQRLDPAVSIVIAVVIAARAVRLLMQAADVLLESTPAGLDLGELAGTMAAVSGVDAVHDLHVWSLSSEVRALSAHLVLSGHPTLEEAQVVGDRVRATIGPRFGIAHATLELECESCVQEDGEPCAELMDHSAAAGSPAGAAGDAGRHLG
ncbi:MAG: cation transporter [Acidimicrobiia bacterium]|nr:cation transporter [Acidimicrobiia bacterium]